MSIFDLLVHVFNFIAPAMAVGCLLALTAPVLNKRWPAARTLASQAAINCVVSGAVLALGLWYYGRDGKMATYSAMVLAAASSQWLQMLRNE